MQSERMEEVYQEYQHNWEYEKCKLIIQVPSSCGIQMSKDCTDIIFFGNKMYLLQKKST